MSAEKELAEHLALLIEDFEGRQYQLPQTKPSNVLNFLMDMDQHGLRQKDLVDVLGTPSIVSEVLSGKRESNKNTEGWIAICRGECTEFRKGESLCSLVDNPTHGNIEKDLNACRSDHF